MQGVEVRIQMAGMIINFGLTAMLMNSGPSPVGPDPANRRGQDRRPVRPPPMAHRLAADPEGALLIATTEGRGTLNGVIALLDAVVTHPQWTPGMAVLMDHRRLTFPALNYEAIEAVCRHFVDLGDRLGEGRLAIVVNQVIDYGNAKIAQMIAGNQTRMPMLVTRSWNEARAWLGLGED